MRSILPHRSCFRRASLFGKDPVLLSHLLQPVCRRHFSLFGLSTDPEVVFEDADYVFVHKPSGLAALGSQIVTPGSTEVPFLNTVREWATARYRFAPSAVLPMDRVSSGLMVFGKHAAAEHHLAVLVKVRSRNPCMCL
jgi:23S rRNA-/tRNA-specific pseudouridylate synthase